MGRCPPVSGMYVVVDLELALKIWETSETAKKVEGFCQSGSQPAPALDPYLYLPAILGHKCSLFFHSFFSSTNLLISFSSPLTSPCLQHPPFATLRTHTSHKHSNSLPKHRFPTHPQHHLSPLHTSALATSTFLAIDNTNHTSSPPFFCLFLLLTFISLYDKQTNTINCTRPQQHTKPTPQASQNWLFTWQKDLLATKNSCSCSFLPEKNCMSVSHWAVQFCSHLHSLGRFSLEYLTQNSFNSAQSTLNEHQLANW